MVGYPGNPLTGHRYTNLPRAWLGHAGSVCPPHPVQEQSCQSVPSAVAEVWVGVRRNPVVLRMLGPCWEIPPSIG